MSNLVSIDNLPTQFDVEQPSSISELVVPELVWDFPLPPHVDRERMMVNMSRLHKLHMVGAIASSRVMSYDGEVTTSIPNLVGINPDGSAMAGGLSMVNEVEASQSERSSYEFQGERLGVVHSTLGKAFLVHSINKPEIASQVSDLTQEKDKSSEEAWAICLDRAIRQSMREGAYKHLMRSGDALSVLLGAGIGLSCLAVSGVEIAGGQTPEFVGAYAFLQAFPSVIQLNIKRRFGGRMPYFNRRFSIVPFGLQPDRYVMTDALSRVPGLVTTRK